MSNYFKNILIPVDLSVNTNIAIAKGLELTSPCSVIHLLHVQRYVLPVFSIGAGGFWMNTIGLTGNDQVELRLNEWKNLIESSGKNIEVCTWNIIDSSIQSAIGKKAKQLNVDLIVIGKNSYHSWFPFLNTVVPSKLVRTTGVAVLTVKPGAMDNKIRTMIVPLSGGSTAHKKEILAFISGKFKLKIHLVTFKNSRNAMSDFDSSGLLQLYQWLRASTHCQVEHAVLQNYNKAKALVDYAQRINADMLLVHPETETRIGWMNKHISDVLPPASKLQILAVQ